ncbi:hypothetical protein [Porphyrobacter sp. YT40]|uniref:hypothetical protein n=1 Tax=Porphyrobacter sp. YT40 TaxID=2547601 RepID=UPI00114452F5|nr:hypothetical protein [Porphyrobacter sp. YT40]QDH34415.1 hypothetical protein E2E27_08840 [Porphyrobacter sp. YT40]
MMDTPPEPPTAQEQLIESKLIGCGLKAGGFSVRYEDYLQSIEVRIMPVAGATPEHFGCIKEAAFPEIVTFEDGPMFMQYNEYLEELYRPQALADARAALDARGLLENFPAREDYATLADYARALEAHAGYAPGTMLQFEGDETLVFDPANNDLLAEADYERLAVLLNVIKFASARDGFTFGFIGNDKYRE